MTLSESTTNSMSNPVMNLVDMDDDFPGTVIANGCNHHQIVSHCQNPLLVDAVTVNGHSLLTDSSNDRAMDCATNNNVHSIKSIDVADGMEHDGDANTTQLIDMDATASSDVQKKSTNDDHTTTHDDNQLLFRILQFGRELHALKQQLTVDDRENQHYDKLLQVRSSSIDSLR
jgi:hypothetical protein